MNTSKIQLVHLRLPGTIGATHTTEAYLDWGRVALIERDTDGKHAVAVLDSGLKVALADDFGHAVEEWQFTRGELTIHRTPGPRGN